jgi:CelD/BcsL family acetyltransferase involved in cellulose biosynthesis
LKKANNLIANRIQREFKALEILWYASEQADGMTVDQLLEDVIQLSARSWKQSTGLTLDQPGPEAFIRRLVPHAATNGWLSVWILKLDGKLSASEIQLQYGGHVHALRADYDLSLRQHSPGSYLNWKLLESLFEKGLIRYWMGPGNNSYKAQWTEEFDSLSTLRVYSTTMRGRMLAFWDQTLRPILRRGRSALRLLAGWSLSKKPNTAKHDAKAPSDT